MHTRFRWRSTKPIKFTWTVETILVKTLFVQFFFFFAFSLFFPSNHNSPNWRGIHYWYFYTPGHWRPLKICSKSVSSNPITFAKYFFEKKIFILIDFFAAKNDLRSQSLLLVHSMQLGRKKRRKKHFFL